MIDKTISITFFPWQQKRTGTEHFKTCTKGNWRNKKEVILKKLSIWA